MKRTVTLLAVFSVMAACLSGCILSTDPDTSTTIILKVGEEKTFKVSGFFNNAYTWVKNSATVATGESYTYTALAADAGQFTIEVRTTELFSTTVISKTWLVKVTNDLPPVAVAGEDRHVAPGTFVQLDGSASYDPEGQTLTYLWEIVQKPEGSTATLSATDIVNPSFTADVAGPYTVRLIVNDGTSNSEAAAVVIRAHTGGAASPTANAGDDQTVNYGSVVTLDGSASSDPDGDALTYMWKIENQPDGSTAVLSDAASASPTFTPNKTGQYVISLVVNDTLYDSNIDYVTITVQNTKPTAEAGGNVTINDVGGSTTLDGSESSDPEDNPLTYQWEITSAPNGSSPTLLNPTSATPTFTPDKKGGYIIKLTVSDGDLSDVDTVTVTYSNHVPVAVVAEAVITVPNLTQATLDGSASYDPDGDTLTYVWTKLSYPSGSTAALSSASVAKPTFTPDKKGTYVFELKVTDTESLPSAPVTVTLTTTNNAPIANAGGDINLLFTDHTTQLSGSGTDVDGDILTYQWAVVSRPNGSSATLLSSTTDDRPIFTPDIKGDYEFSLVVNDGTTNSTLDTVSVHVYNNAPTAVATVGDTTVQKGTMATLNGSASYDIDGTALTYAWTITTKPSGSSAALSSATAASPTFTPDKDGSYTFTLVVSDGDLTSTTTVGITAYTVYDGSFESGIVSPWSVTVDDAKYELTDDYAHGGYVSFNPRAKAFYENNNQVTLTLAFPQSTYVYSISCWMYREGSESSAVHSELYVDSALMLNGDPAPFAPHGDGKYHILDPGHDIENRWVQRTWAVNAWVSNIYFIYNDLWLIDDIYLDDIVINTWGD